MASGRAWVWGATSWLVTGTGARTECDYGCEQSVGVMKRDPTEAYQPISRSVARASADQSIR
jgi:hypothetical protein